MPNFPWGSWFFTPVIIMALDVLKFSVNGDYTPIPPHVHISHQIYAKLKMNHGTIGGRCPLLCFVPFGDATDCLSIC